MQILKWLSAFLQLRQWLIPSKNPLLAEIGFYFPEKKMILPILIKFASQRIDEKKIYKRNMVELCSGDLRKVGTFLTLVNDF